MQSTSRTRPSVWALAVFGWTVVLAGATASAEIVVSPPEVVLTSQRPPVYPPAALRARFSGTVTVEAVVQKDGTVGDVRVLACSRPSVGFEDATIAAVKKWQFEPARRGEEAIDYPLKFRLSFTGGGTQAGPRVSAGSFTETDSSGHAIGGAAVSGPGSGKSN